ncbi:hypothetical protein BG005_010531 [Podila minutissima]|nr:hypothetical protein BG005_010531 [Podila minutissima]
MASSSASSLPPSSHDPPSTPASTQKQSSEHVWIPGQELAAKLVFGGMGCMIAVVFTNPVDVIKVRLQFQGEAVVATPHPAPPSPHSSSVSRILPSSQPQQPHLILTSGSHLSSAASTVVSNTIHRRDNALLAHKAPTAAASILRNEGPRVVMAGLAPAILREGVYSTIRFGSYDLFKGIYSGMGTSNFRGGEETSTLVKLMSGLTSGMLGSTIANPTDLIKVRLQAFWPSGKPRYSSIADACRSIYVEEGIPGLYRGVVPTAARAMVVAASQLASYDTTKHWLLRLRDSKGEAQFREGYLVHFVASTVADWCAPSRLRLSTRSRFDTGISSSMHRVKEHFTSRRSIALSRP